jgi:diguanylate cyclase (GGDEF)-like protein
MPLLAQDECLKCHHNASIGNVLGVVEVEQDISMALGKAKSGTWQLILLGAPIILILAGGLAYYVTSRIGSAIHSFGRQVEHINSVRDIQSLEPNSVDFCFKELNQITQHIDGLTERMRAIAVDKDILELEVKLLDKFIITSDVLRDWRRHISNLLQDINTIINTYALFTLFRNDNGELELEIFWRNRPSVETQDLLEYVIHVRLRENGTIGAEEQLATEHTTAEPDHELVTLTRDQIEINTRDLIVDAPYLGGAVGIGVQSQPNTDPIRHVVIDSILATLLNLVGSAKAIYRYTRDLEYYATRDPLTELYNQRVFRDLVRYEVKRAERYNYPFSLIMIDLDNFKPINDRYGHTFGDSYMVEFATMLRKEVNSGDVLSRYGGDEFGIMMPETDESQAYALAQSIIEAASQVSLAAPDGQRLRISCSIGIAVFPQHGKEARDLFLITDNMLYRAKEEGKNAIRVPGEEELGELFKVVGEQGAIILNAIEQRRLVPFFQPIVSTDGHDQIHELLMRIEHEGQIMAAGQFIELAERMGLVPKMDYLLFEAALRKISQSGYQGKLFVNLSPRSLVMGDAIHNMRALCHEYRIDPSRVVFELTERDTVRSLSLLESFVAELKQEGFKFAIDDFGSGFSSFQFVRRLPIDYIKIEGEFVRNMVNDYKDSAFVVTIATLAQQLGLKTVAEFVEDEQTLKEVREAGIDYAQGFYTGKPGPEFV